MVGARRFRANDANRPCSRLTRRVLVGRVPAIRVFSRDAASKTRTPATSAARSFETAAYKLTPMALNNQNAEVNHSRVRMAKSVPPATGSAQPG